MSMAMAWGVGQGTRSAGIGLPPGLPRKAPPCIRERRDPGFARSIRLLSNTNQRISLFRLSFGGLDPDVVDAVIAELFDQEALIYRLGDGTLLLLVVRFDLDDLAATAHIAALLEEALDRHDGAAGAAVTVTALHRHTALIGDSDELLAELSFSEPLVLRSAA